jgi:hypothetical protein
VQSKIWQTFKGLKAKYWLLLFGTPIINSEDDLEGLTALLEPDGL